MSFLITSSVHLTTEIVQVYWRAKVVYLYGNTSTITKRSLNWSPLCVRYQINVDACYYSHSQNSRKSRNAAIFLFWLYRQKKIPLFLWFNSFFEASKVKSEENNSLCHAGEAFAPLFTLKCLFHMHAQQQCFSALATMPKLSAETSNLLLWIT